MAYHGNPDLEVDSVPFNDITSAEWISSQAPRMTTTAMTLIDGGIEKPIITIIEQPKARDSRFRYKSEGETAGSLHGENSKVDRASYPTVQIDNCKCAGELVVTLASKEDPPCPHPYSLVGKDCINGMCIIPVGPGQQIVSCAGMGIRCEKKKDISEAFEMKKSSYKQPFRDETSRRPEDLDINACRLCYQIFLRHPNYSNTYIVSDPVLSVPIYDKKAASTCNLQIVRLDKTSGKVTGGDEIYMLVEKVKKEDIEVQFIEGNWKSRGDFGQSDVHKQFAIVFKTPAYYKLDIQHAVTVHVKLYRPSNGEYSDPVKFMYKPAITDCEGIQRKRQKVVDFTKFLTGRQPVIHQGPLLPKPETLQSIPSVKERVRQEILRHAEPQSSITTHMAHYPYGQTRMKRPLDTDVYPPMNVSYSANVKSEDIHMTDGYNTQQLPQSASHFNPQMSFNQMRGPPRARQYSDQVRPMPSPLHIKKPPNDFPFSSVLSYSGPGVTKDVNQVMGEILERPVQIQQKSPRPAAEATTTTTTTTASFSHQYQNVSSNQKQNFSFAQSGSRPLKLSPFIESSSTDSCFYDASTSDNGSPTTSDTAVDTLTSEVIEEWKKYMKDGDLPPALSQQFFGRGESEQAPVGLKLETNPAKETMSGFLDSDVECDSSPVIEMDDPFRQIPEDTMDSGTITQQDVLVEEHHLDVPQAVTFDGAAGLHIPSQQQPALANQMPASSYSMDTTVTEESSSSISQMEASLAVYPTATHRFDHTGGKLEITDYGVSLIVPPNAISEGQSQDISVSVSWNKADKPTLCDGEALVSPVVCCEPNGLKFNSPVTLSFQHCLNFKDKDTDKISLQSSQSKIGEGNEWIKKGVLETGGPTCIVSKDRCVIFTDHFTKYGLSAQMGEEMTKRIKVAIYATPLTGTICDETLRVYAINATADAEQEMKAEEKDMGGILADAVKSYHLKENISNDLDVSITRICEGWKLISGSDKETLSKKDIMAGCNSSCSFTFANEYAKMNFRCQVDVKQEGNDSKVVSTFISRPVQLQGQPNPGSAVTSFSQLPPPGNPCLAVAPIDYPHVSAATPGVPIARGPHYPYTPNLAAVSRQDVQCYQGFSLITEVRRPAVQFDVPRACIPFELKNELALRLNPLHTFGRDWRMLANEMGHSKYIRNLEGGSNPTEQLLDVLECCYSAQECLPMLIKMLTKIERSDAVHIVQSYLQHKSVDVKTRSLFQSESEGEEEEEEEVEMNKQFHPDLVNVTESRLTLPDLQSNLNLLGSPNPDSSLDLDPADSPAEGDEAQFAECESAIRALNELCNPQQNVPQHPQTTQRSKSDEDNMNVFFQDGISLSNN
ncbi:uncharacterized protein LOC144451822 [Glandiceps talaboti]